MRCGVTLFVCNSRTELKLNDQFKVQSTHFKEFTQDLTQDLTQDPIQNLNQGSKKVMFNNRQRRQLNGDKFTPDYKSTDLVSSCFFRAGGSTRYRER